MKIEINNNNNNINTKYEFKDIIILDKNSNYFNTIYNNKFTESWIENIKLVQNKLTQESKPLEIDHRNILVRWLAQIDNDGSDSYRTFKKIKSNGTKKYKYLVEKLNKIPNNWLISSDALKEINKIKDGNKADIKYEHNPPVKVIWEKIQKLEGQINIKDILNVIKDNKYCIMIITKNEHDNLHNSEDREGERINLREDGDFNSRIKHMYSKNKRIPKFYYLSKKN